nr:unnamed protein product [Spirometra erinaceieuropaei]
MDRKVFEKDLLNRAGVNPKVLYSYIRQGTRKKYPITLLRTAEGMEISDDKDKTEHISQFFRSVVTSEPDFFSLICEDEEIPTLKAVFFTEAIVRNELLNLKESTSPGPDAIPAKLLKEPAPKMSKPLALIFQTSFLTRCLHSDWKSDTITPLFRSGSRASANNYRPVSFTSICCKIMEKIIKKALMQFLEQHHLLSDAQHGFRSGRSCLTNLLFTLERWTKARDEGSVVHAIYIDFKKTFDSVPNQRLLQKQRNAGIRGRLLVWIQSFLAGRSQRVKVGSQQSPEGPIFNQTIRFLKVSSTVCVPGKPVKRNLDAVVIVKSAVYNFADRDRLCRFFAKGKRREPEFRMTMVFSVGLPRSSGGRFFQRDGFNSSLPDRAGEAMEEMQTKRSEVLRNLTEEARINGDLVLGDYEDTYYNLSLKLFRTYQWASTLCRPHFTSQQRPPVFIFLDDDFAFNVRRMKAELGALTDAQIRRVIWGLPRNHSPAIRHLDSKRCEKWSVSKREIPWPYYPHLAPGCFAVIGADVLREIALAMYFTLQFPLDDACETCFNPSVVQPFEDTTIVKTVQLTEAMVLTQLLRLKKSKSPGPDAIPAKILKEVAGEFAKPLSILFHASSETAHLPPDWKSAWITPLDKGRSRVSANNHRPVCLIPICCKIMVKITKQQLIQFLERKPLLSDSQDGFRSIRSCVTNLLYCLGH